tara:strand:+ start:1195 stop:2124 length:930 start_codon:yes stop_codon:yes gene_type:complete
MSERDPLEHLYAYRPQRQSYGARRISIRMILMVVFLVMAVIVWVAYPRGAERYQDIDLPYVRADQTPYKVRPVEPGGEYIPHQDSTVFEPLETVQDVVVENILPEPEEPMDREEVAEVVANQEASQQESLVKPPSLNLDIKLTEEASKVESLKPKMINVKEALEKQDERQIHLEEQAEKTAPVSKPAAKPNLGDKPVTLKKTTPLAVKGQSRQAAQPKFSGNNAQAPSGLYYVQLGAFKDKPSAQQEYRKAVLTFGSLINDLNVNYQYADLGSKGVYFRVKLGPMAEGAARSLCKKMLDKKPGACFVTK